MTTYQGTLAVEQRITAGKLEPRVYAASFQRDGKPECQIGNTPQELCKNLIQYIQSHPSGEELPDEFNLTNFQKTQVKIGLGVRALKRPFSDLELQNFFGR